MINIKGKYVLFLVAIYCLAFVIFSRPVSAADAKSGYVKAESCFKALIQNPDKKRLRSNWLNCIKQFTDAHDDDPAGPWAAACLFQAGLMYQELYKYSGKLSDQQAATDLFQKVVANYPKSIYHKKARERLGQPALRQAAESPPPAPAKAKGTEPQAVKTKNSGPEPAGGKTPEPESARGKVTEPEPDKTVSPEPEPVKAGQFEPEKAKSKYAEAEALHQKLKASAARRKYRCYWLECINAYQDVYPFDPKGPLAAASLYTAGALYGELYKSLPREEDREEGRRLLEQVISEFPDSTFRDKASAALQNTETSGVVAADKSSPASSEGESPPASAAQAVTEPPLPGGMAVVTEVRYWSNPTYTRVVVDATGPVEFSHNLLKDDPVGGKPPRLYIDLQNSRLHQELSRQITIDDNLLKDIRAGQYTPTSVRVVVDIKSFKSYKVFSLQDPFRLIIDVSGEGGEEPPPPAAEKVTSIPVPGKGEKKTLAQQLGLSVRRIVIDPGHGGKDSGALGYSKDIQEKKVVLEISRTLADRIRKELGCEVIMTRDTDTYLTLEERTAIANMKNADLFISVHTNASRTSDAYGIETYMLNLATDEDAMRVAAMENSTSQKNMSDLQTILQDLMQNAKISESTRLAGYVQNALCGHLQKRYDGIKSKGVKQAPFYVLIGAQMPSILIETGFISNKEECRRLMNPDYQRQLCDGILKGIKTYIDQTSAAGFAPPAVEGKPANNKS